MAVIIILWVLQEFYPILKNLLHITDFKLFQLFVAGQGSVAITDNQCLIVNRQS